MMIFIGNGVGISPEIVAKLEVAIGKRESYMHSSSCSKHIFGHLRLRETLCSVATKRVYTI